jgi:hypothetical protein
MKKILIAPQKSVASGSLIVAIANHLKLEIVPSGPADAKIWMSDAEQPDRSFINWRLKRLDKRRLGMLHGRYMGHEISVNPEQYEGLAVEKILGHNVHGKVKRCPMSANPNRVYQKLLTNKNGEGGTVEEFRIHRTRNLLTFVRKSIPLNKEGIPTEHHPDGYFDYPVEGKGVMSDAELENVLKLLNALGVDWGEVDLIRHEDGLLYVIDVTINIGIPKTEWMPFCTREKFIRDHAEQFKAYL